MEEAEEELSDIDSKPDMALWNGAIARNRARMICKSLSEDLRISLILHICALNESLIYSSWI